MPRGRRPAEQTKVETKIAAWRVKRGMTQEEVAERTGLSLSGYRKIERGYAYNPGILHLSQVAFILGCELDDILEERWKPGYLPKGTRHSFKPRDLWRNKD